MTPSAYRVPAGVYTALAEGGGGPAVGVLAAAQYSKQVLLVRRVLDVARETGHAEAGTAGRAYDLLADVQDKDPAAVEAVLRHPAVEGWAHAAIDAMTRSAGAEATAARTRMPAAEAPRPARLAALAAAAAIRAGHACSVEVPVDGGAVVLPSVGKATVAVTERTAHVTVSWPHAELAWSGGRVTVPADRYSDGPGWQGMRRLWAATDGRSLELIIDDLDAHRMPGAANVAPRLGRVETAQWQAALSDAWRLLVTRHPTLADEVAAAIRVLTPLTPPPGGHVSATSRETFGSIALSRPADGCALAVAFAHETQHAKLSALLDLVPMTRSDDGSRHYAPWREDPRPVAGLLQGCYAFLGVAGFWLRQAEHDTDDRVEALAEFTRWRDAVGIGLRTVLNSGRLTDAGERFVAGMDRTLRAWERLPVPAPAREIADRAAREHRDRWVRNNGPIGAPA